jgi:hypothetical protein
MGAANRQATFAEAYLKSKKEQEGRVIWKTPVILKWVLPGFLIGLLLLIGIIQLGAESPSPVIVLFPAVALGLVGLFAQTIWALADEVTDRGDFLVFRKGDTRQVVRLEDIVNISADSCMVPKKLTV